MRRFGPRSLISLAVVSAVASAQSQVNWEKTLPVAVQHATATKTPIFIDLYAEWCGPCKMLEKDVFSDRKVQALMKRATCLRLDIDQNPDAARRFQVNSIPRLLLLSSDGKKVLWDTMGYRDADTFAQEFAEALGVKDTGARALSAPPEPPALAKVSGALRNGSFRQLEAADPKTAHEGLRLIVQQFGADAGKGFSAQADLLKKAGRDAVPDLLDGMGDKYLAVRVGAYRVIQSILTKSELSNLRYNPWAPTATRTAQLESWSRLHKSHG